MHGRKEVHFLVELIQELRERDGFVETDGVWHLRYSHQELSNLYPTSIQNMIQRKIDQLPTASRVLLLAAAVQGIESTLSLLATLPGWTQPRPRTCFGTLIRFMPL